MFKKVCLFFVLFLSFFFGPLSWAAMQSANYIIYENIHHSFDGPVISAVNVTVSGITPTITWTTDVAANSFVEYSTDSALANSKEQGTDTKIYTNHSVNLSGLSANTTYYFRVKSERVNGGKTTDATIHTFTTGSDPSSQTTTPTGGGILIIDKTDKKPPTISNVTFSVKDDGSVAIGWQTDEGATSFVEYGTTESYGNTYGHWASTTDHTVVLSNLQAKTIYQFRALSSDDWGNVGYSENYSFNTGSIGQTEETEPEEIKPTEPEEKTDEKTILEQVSARTLEFISRIFPEISLNNITSDQIANINSLEELSGFIPAPILSGEPRVTVGATEATIGWTTDVEANSLVAMAPEDKYNPESKEPYLQVVGNSEELTLNHEVSLYNLSPNTTYHFQLRSKARLGDMAKSRDFTLKTTLEEFKIESFLSQIINAQEVNFKWVTNKEADAAVTLTPYHNNILAVDQSKTFKNNTISVIHEVKASGLEAGVIYLVEITSQDLAGNIAQETIDRFSTAEDDLPPEISHIKADSTVFLDRSNKTQTILSWLTNEPATSRLYYQEGVHGGDAKLAESTELNTNYTKEHVIVITKFKPGVVYSFRVESIDSGGNVSLSKVHTFMTAKKSESIIQVIIRILENTFGWMKKLR